MAHDELAVIPAEVPRAGNGFSQWLGHTLLRLAGWQIVGSLPAQRRFVIVVAPHTSNWDFFVGITAVMALRLKLAFLAKHSLFVGPVGWLLRRIGGIAVNRASANGVVGQLTELFAESEQLIVAMTPEGTRKKVTKWKSGCIHISYQAGVPLLFAYFDYANKVIGFGPCRQMSADIKSEMTQMKAYYGNIVAKNPDNA